MFSPLEHEIFPDNCEVLGTTSQFFVYPIFKNGSSSLNEWADQMKWRRWIGPSIGAIDTEVHVYLRDPRQRFISGINTFAQHNSKLDLDTLLTFINRYGFINRHFAPQFFWILNLARFLPHTTPLVLHSIDDLHLVTPLHSDAKILPVDDKFLEKFNKFDWQYMELYYYLDQRLTDLIGNKILFSELVNDIRTQDSNLYWQVFHKSINIVEMMRGLS